MLPTVGHLSPYAVIMKTDINELQLYPNAQYLSVSCMKGWGLWTGLMIEMHPRQSEDHFSITTLFIHFFIISTFTDDSTVYLLSHCMITWPIYQCEMGLERRTGNEMNWMAVKAPGQSALVVIWDTVNRLLLDCNWTVVSLSQVTLSGTPAVGCWTYLCQML